MLYSLSEIDYSCLLNWIIGEGPPTSPIGLLKSKYGVALCEAELQIKFTCQRGFMKLVMVTSCPANPHAEKRAHAFWGFPTLTIGMIILHVSQAVTVVLFHGISQAAHDLQTEVNEID